MGFFNKLTGLLTRPAQLQQHPAKFSSDASRPVVPSVETNIQAICITLGNSADIIVRRLKLGAFQRRPAALLFQDGLASTEMIQNTILKSILLDATMQQAFQPALAEAGSSPGLDNMEQQLLAVAEVTRGGQLPDLVSAILSGLTVLLLEGESTALLINTRAWEDRGINEPANESVIRGPRDGFNETLRTNAMLIRRRIKSPKLRYEMMQLGKITKTDVGLMFIEDRVNPAMLTELRTRLGRVDLDSVLESGYLESFIEEQRLTPFPTVYNSERPDVISAGLLAGKIAILVDGTPFVLLVPCLFTEFYTSAEDYNHRADSVALIRMLRLICLGISLLGPSLYIAVTTFHQEMLPTQLLISLASSREGIPFPAFVEALIMEVIFEILREASIRMPRIIGPTMSIVGALVLGQASIQAGLVSPAMVIVVSLTAITNFVIPSYTMAISVRMLRFLFMGLAAMFGLFGMLFGFVYLLQHLCSLNSFGVSYMTPYTPSVISSLNDSFFMRAPWKWLGRNSLLKKFQSPTKQPEGGGQA